MMTAVTMTYAGEAIGITDAASAEGLPVVISFTVETDGRLPSGQELGEADHRGRRGHQRCTGVLHGQLRPPHPLRRVLEEGGSWVERVKGVRANASTMSHAELDDAEELDRGDVPGLARHYAELRRILPDMRVAGGCCGTDAAHISAIAAELSE